MAGSNRFAFLHSRFGRRIFFVFIGCALLPVAALVFYAYWEIGGQLQDQTRQRLRHASKNAGMALYQQFTFLQTELENLRSRVSSGLISPPHFPPTEENTLNQRLKALFLLSPNGHTLSLFGPSPPPWRPDNVQLSHLGEAKALLFSWPGGDDQSRLFMAVSASPNAGGGELLVAELNPAYLWEMAGRAIPPNADMHILPPGGGTLFNPVPVPGEAIADLRIALARTISGQIEWQQHENSVLGSYWSLFLEANYLAGNWTILVSEPREQALASAARFLRTFYLGCALSLLVVLLLSSVLVRRSLDPLAELEKGTRRISRGDLEHRVEVSSGDEFEDLAQSFNVMAGRLDNQFRALNESSRIVRSVLGALDQAKIIAVITGELGATLSCRWIGLALLNPDAEGRGSLHLRRREELGGAEEVSLQLPREELDSLVGTGNYLVSRSGTEFPHLLAPIAQQGAGAFVVLPIFLLERLVGALCLGYPRIPEDLREECLLARQVADQIGVALSNTRLLSELEQLNWGALTALARTVDASSPWTAGHSERVTRLALGIGQEMGLSTRELDLLQRGSLLHDIGKIGIPSQILDKPGPLDKAEYSLIQTHPSLGARILEPIAAFREILPIVHQHHERFDGRGYPFGLCGNAIALGARIVAVADVFDSLTSDRPYRIAWEREKGLEHLRTESGKHFDPQVVEGFIRSYPALASALSPPPIFAPEPARI